MVWGASSRRATWTIGVSRRWLGTGSYRLRVDVGRGVQLETDASYSNDSISGANQFALEVVGARRSGTIAGTIRAAAESVDEDYFNLGAVNAGESILVSLRLPESSSLVRPVVEIRDSRGNPLAVVVSPIETAARAHITTRDNYYVSVVTLAGQGSHGQYLMDAAVWPASGLDFPDLVVKQVTAPTAASSGETVRVSWTVRNFGTVKRSRIPITPAATSPTRTTRPRRDRGRRTRVKQVRHWAVVHEGCLPRHYSCRGN